MHALRDTSPHLKLIEHDFTQSSESDKLFAKSHFSALISCVPHTLHSTLVHLCDQYQVDYFDATEDTVNTALIARLAATAHPFLCHNVAWHPASLISLHCL